MLKVVLLRHGESTWNRENRFTGWTDVDLSGTGYQEAATAGRVLRDLGYVFDVVYVSVLRRALRTLWLVQEAMDLLWLPVEKDWRLNERHYGALQGLNKAEIIQHYGADQVHAWRRGFSTPPPALNPSDPRHPRFDARYGRLPLDCLPATESLQDTLQRVLRVWHDLILLRMRAGERLLIVAHGNTLRALIKYLDRIPDEDIADLSIPTGVPLVYEFHDTLEVIVHYDLRAEIAQTAGRIGPTPWVPHRHSPQRASSDDLVAMT